MKTMRLLLFIMLLGVALGQCQSAIPRPFVYGGLDLGDSAAGIVGGGVAINATHFVLNTEASYDTDGKSDDNTGHNPKGRNRKLKGTAYYRLSNGLYFGGGARWSRLDTSNYAKQQWHPVVGMGKDFIRDTFSFRLQGDYALPGAEHVSPQGCTVPKGQCTNQLQGAEISFFIPSPALAKHFFVRFLYGGYLGHTTVTSIDPVLTAQQKASRVVTGESQMTLLYRF